MMEALAAVILLVLLPGAIELLLVTVGAILPKHRQQGQLPPGGNLVVVIPAHNEEKYLGRTLQTLKGNDVLVVADNCTDQTAKIARDSGCRVLERYDEVHRGKSYALNDAFKHLANENNTWIAVVDADAVVSEGFTQAILASTHEAVQVFYGVDPSLNSWRHKLLRIAFYAMNGVRLRGRWRLGLSAGICGNGFAIRKSLLERVPYHTHTLVEDLSYHLALIKTGHRVEYSEQGSVYAAFPDKGPGVAIQRTRWEGGRLSVAKQEILPLLKGLLEGNWRYFEPLCELMTLPLGFQVMLAFIAALLTTGWLLALSFGMLVLIAAHILLGIALKGSIKDLWALAFAPFYILWKITTLPALWQSLKRSAPWIRTPR